MTGLGTRVGGKKKQTQKRRSSKKLRGGFLNKPIGGDATNEGLAPATEDVKPAATEDVPVAEKVEAPEKPWWKFWGGKRQNKTVKKRNNKKHK